VRRVIRWQLTGDQPKDLRLTWHANPGARAWLDEEIFGKPGLITSHDDWPVPDVVAGYRSQSEAEFSFRQMKDPHVVSFSPMHHWTEHNIRVNCIGAGAIESNGFNNYREENVSTFYQCNPMKRAGDVQDIAEAATRRVGAGDL